jgi:predicted nucleic acid-binding protein
MRIVIDTGVFISAALKAQTVPSIAMHRAAQQGVPLKSHASEAELMDVIDRPYLARLIAPAVRAHVLDLMAHADRC